MSGLTDSITKRFIGVCRHQLFDVQCTYYLYTKSHTVQRRCNFLTVFANVMSLSNSFFQFAVRKLIIIIFFLYVYLSLNLG